MLSGTPMDISQVDVLFEDNHLLIVNKPAGILVQGDATGDVPLVELCKQYIGTKYNKPGEVFLGVIHRLDRPVSGVVAFARTSKALERMNKLFRDKKAKKTYWAIVGKKPSERKGTLVHWLTKDEKKNKAAAHDEEVPGSKRSELHYEVIQTQSGFYLLEVNPITGRAHQIRVQLASMNCPIAGDLKYGFQGANSDASICLHSRSLEFIHPVRKEAIRVEAPAPNKEHWQLFG